MSASWAFLDTAHPLAIAHRGGGGAQENSMAAFQRAVDLGYRYVETDVHATADGVLLAFHDARLDRVTDRTGAVLALAHTTVAQARIAGTEPIPLLADVLHTWPDLRVNVDVKSPHAIGPLLDVLRRTHAWDRVCVASFSDRRLAAVRAAAGPRLATSLGPREVMLLRAAGYDRRFAARLPRAVAAAQVPERAGRVRLVDERLVAAAHRHGLDVHVWTVNDPAAMTRLLDLGVDGIVTDDLVALRTVLESRGAWTGDPAR